MHSITSISAHTPSSSEEALEADSQEQIASSDPPNPLWGNVEGPESLTEAPLASEQLGTDIEFIFNQKAYEPEPSLYRLSGADSLETPYTHMISNLFHYALAATENTEEENEYERFVKRKNLQEDAENKKEHSKSNRTLISGISSSAATTFDLGFANEAESDLSSLAKKRQLLARLKEAIRLASEKLRKLQFKALISHDPDIRDKTSEISLLMAKTLPQLKLTETLMNAVIEMMSSAEKSQPKKVSTLTGQNDWLERQTVKELEQASSASVVIAKAIDKLDNALLELRALVNHLTERLQTEQDD